MATDQPLAALGIEGPAGRKDLVLHGAEAEVGEKLARERTWRRH
jgi:hypothetical protein